MSAAAAAAVSPVALLLLFAPAMVLLHPTLPARLGAASCRCSTLLALMWTWLKPMSSSRPELQLQLLHLLPGQTCLKAS
jgi:hypothetical protein